MTELEIKHLYYYEYIYLGKTLRQVASEKGIGDNTLRKHFKNNSLKIKNGGQRTGIKKPTVNSLAFHSWTKEMAYWLGYLAADGSINKNTLTVYSKRSDWKQLNKLKEFLQTSKTIKFTEVKLNNKIYEAAYIAVSDKTLIKKLKELGIIPNKSHKDIDFLSYVPKEFKTSFLIGYFDGDGSIYKGKLKNNYTWYAVWLGGNEVFLKSVREFLVKKYNFNFNKLKKTPSEYMVSISWSSKKDLKTFSYIYTKELPNNLVLKRKYEKVLEFIEFDDKRDIINKNLSWLEFNSRKKKVRLQKNYKVKKEYFCKNCNKKITSESKSGLCNPCSNKLINKSFKLRVVERPSKEELKKLIMKKPFISIAKDYGVSDNAIRKWCKHYNLPYRKKEIELLKK